MIFRLFLVGIVSSKLFGRLSVDETELEELDIQRTSRIPLELPELWFDQKVNHKACTNETFKQRYFMNHQFYKKGGPAFLFIGGEGELNYKWAQLSVLTKAAEQHGGVVFALEHRYYGKSWPTPDFSTKNLKHLSSQQALADMAAFMVNVPMPKRRGGVEYCETDKPKWIVAGGSYPGNLAAWVRDKYPHIVTGAIASSAPVFAKEDFFEYDQQVQKALAKNGGESCATYYHDVIGAIDAGLRSNDQTYIHQIKSEFGCSDVTDLAFADALTYVAGKVQYNRDNILKDYCSQLNLNGSIFAKLADFARDFKRELDGKTCKEYSDLGEATSIVPKPANNMRQWIYQCCTEFGYWQTAPHSPNPRARSSLLDVKFARDSYCRALFGEYPAIPNIERTNNYYKGYHINTTNIFFTNGELDPWTPLSVTTAKEGIPTFVLEGASHARDLGYPNPKDPLPIKQAKEMSLALISKWLGADQDQSEEN